MVTSGFVKSAGQGYQDKVTLSHLPILDKINLTNYLSMFTLRGRRDGDCGIKSAIVSFPVLLELTNQSQVPWHLPLFKRTSRTTRSAPRQLAPFIFFDRPMVMIGNGKRTPLGRIVTLIKKTRAPLEAESGQFLVVVSYDADGSEGPVCNFVLFDLEDQAKAVQLYILKTNAIPPIAVTAAERENYNSAMGGCVRKFNKVDTSGMRRLHALLSSHSPIELYRVVSSCIESKPARSIASTWVLHLNIYIN